MVNVAYVAHITQLAAFILQNANMFYGKTIVIADFFCLIFKESVPRPILSSNRDVRHFVC